MQTLPIAPPDGNPWRTGGDVLLVAPPFRGPNHGNIALATLKPLPMEQQTVRPAAVAGGRHES